jgi:parvulin-like peptidyl-prolyl isomerase
VKTTVLALALIVACSKDSKDSGSANTDIESKDILARTETAPEVGVKHVLIGWKELGKAYGGHMDPRAEKRTQQDAAKLAVEIADKLRANPDSIDQVVKENSEDPGSLSGEAYAVKPDTQFVPEFKKLALRLKVKEIGIVKTDFGYHVMERVPPDPPDPVESADILARQPEAGPVHIQHVMIGWKGRQSPDPRAQKRTKAEADKLAKETLDKVRGGADMKALMKELSEDPTSKDNGQAYEIGNDSGVPDSFKNLALRLKEGEAGIVKSIVGWHVMKRVPPPPPDPLESADILKRAQVTDKAKVKHILLGWTEVHADDPRGTKRTREELDKLVKATVDKLKKGTKIETLMAELSEDSGSAKIGKAYDVSPQARLVPPFKKLSLRLNKGEVGVVKTDFGIHIIQRVE